MSIIGSLKRVILGAGVEPVERGSTQAMPLTAEPVVQETVAIGPEPQNQPQQFFQTSSQQTPETWPNADTRMLMKEATALKRAKRYDEAVAMLRRAYQTPPGPMTIQERLRLPMYLQLAGHADEGWGEMNRLNITYVDQPSQIAIAAHMAVFLRKEGNYKNAALFAAWTLCKYKELDVNTHAYLVHSADQKPARAAEWETLGLPPWPQNMPITGTTPSGNPIYDVSYPAVHRRLTEDYDRAAIRVGLEDDLSKVVAREIISAVVTDLSRYLAKPPPYDIESVKRILAEHLT